MFAAALIVAGVALFVAAPLGIGRTGDRHSSASELDLERCEHQRGLAVQGLKELEFDREMGKLSDLDYQSMHANLEDRALTAMTAIEKLHAGARKPPPALAAAPRRAAPSIPRVVEIAPHAAIRTETAAPTPRKISYCPQCGTRAVAGANFCAQCGTGFQPISRATNRTE